MPQSFVILRARNALYLDIYLLSSQSYTRNRAESHGIIQPGNILANPKLRNLYNARFERTRREKQHGGRNITFPTRSRVFVSRSFTPTRRCNFNDFEERKKEGKKKKKKNKKKEKKYTSVEKRASSQAIEKQIVPPV